MFVTNSMMLHVTNRQPLSSQFGAFTDPAVHAVVFLALLHSCRGEELETKKHPSFRGRTSLFINELEKGNISLKLSKVKVSDEGGYKCVMLALSKASSVQLVVGSVSSPVVQMTKNNNGVLLECESADWYPEPEMFWLDGEGNLLSAEPTETVRGPDGLYTVSSRVTVEKSHGRKFTCRVTQRKINQTRENHLTIPDHLFMLPSTSSPSSTPHTHFVIGAVIGCAAFIFVVWRRRQKKFKNKKTRREDGSEHSEEEKLVTFKSDKTGFQVVNEKEEERLHLISVKDENNPDKTGEKSETEDEGQRRETNAGDESEQETVKPVRDDSGHSIQIKHINTDQKMEKEETQQEAASDEDEKETKTEKERPKKEKKDEQINKGVSRSTGQKKQEGKGIQVEAERESVESKEMLQSEIKKGENKDETELKQQEVNGDQCLFKDDKQERKKAEPEDKTEINKEGNQLNITTMTEEEAEKQKKQSSEDVKKTEEKKDEWGNKVSANMEGTERSDPEKHQDETGRKNQEVLADKDLQTEKHQGEKSEPDQDETKYQPAESKEGVGVEIKQRQEERQEAGLQEDNDTTQRKSVEILNQIRGVEEEKQAEQQLDVKVKVREQREESKEGVMVEDNGRGEESLETDRKASVDETQRKAEGKENQRRRREEATRQAAARRREYQHKGKGITEEIKVEWTDGEKQESVTDKEADTDETQKKHKTITSESKGGEQQLMLQHSDMNKEMRERGVEGQEDLQQEEDMETDQSQLNVIQSIEPRNTQEEGLHIDQQQRDDIRRNSEEGSMQIEASSEMRTQGHEEQNMNLIKEQQQQGEDMETDQPQPNVIQSIEPLNTPFQYESATEGQSKEAFGRGQKEVQPQNINTDQKQRQEERQEAGLQEDNDTTQRKSVEILNQIRGVEEEKQAEQQLDVKVREQREESKEGVMVEDNGRGEESLETDRKASVDETQRKAEGKENQRRRRREEAVRQEAQTTAKGMTEEIKVEWTDGEKQESVTDKEADTYEIPRKRMKKTSES
ncbi:trichohyalin-like [Labrus mixtus]|uniref:trichohyalin-like n=1 Tax=Labrus mixtus TaxID=508554 RepID=UPI0029C0E983|nr:trichohyalin-like [Labrus mixtus]